MNPGFRGSKLSPVLVTEKNKNRLSNTARNRHENVSLFGAARVPMAPEYQKPSGTHIPWGVTSRFNRPPI